MANNVSSVILSAMDLKVHFGEQVVLDKASLSVHESDRIGLVGRNGSGKSTFLKIISGIMQPDSGEVAERKDLVIGFLSQEFTLDESKTVYQNILDGAQRELTLIDEYENTPFDSPNKQKLEEEILRLDSWHLEKRINILIRSLSAPEGIREISTLSGGEKRRTALCRALLSKPNLLILDEPTNHLDTNSIEWLEDFLATYSGTCIFVTHDRYFLDRIANRIVELSGGTFYSHSGNYTDYLVNKAERKSVQEVEDRKRQNFLKRELEWVRRGPKARRTKAKSRLNKFEEVSNQKETDAELDVELIIPPANRLGKKIVELTNVSIILGNKSLFDEFNYNFLPGKKIGVVGPNGSGKTTLLRIILEEISPTKGKVEIGENTEFNYIDQARLLLDDSDTVKNVIGEGSEIVKFGNQKLSVWSYLKRFLFTDDRINTLVGRLSGGEKSRLTLAKILSSGGNFLMLDEPTNDLDLPTLRILEEALVRFEGCVIIVSHDRYFLNRICDGIIAFEGDGQVYYSEGDYDYYIKKRQERLRDKADAKPKQTKEDSRIKVMIRKLTYNEKIELESIEEKIIIAEEDVNRIENIFSSAEFYEKHAEQTNELNIQLAEAKDKVKLLYDRWEQLEEISKSGNIKY
ncbi:MAG: ATP-binding cassette domain-containing protein [Ignavibacteriaceae bacterium]